ncbi:hypothetical protein [Streptomyces sp. NPDC006267]|uniref:hypothetical protein n=1 Tax=unclassified Streptomyces TaxID=2593676 RepID=UPI0033A43D42
MAPEPHEHLPPRTHEEELFREALRRTVGPLSLQPDLIPDAVREGHRRRARTRAFAVVGAFVAVTAVTLGLSVLGPRPPAGPGPDTGPAAPAGPPLSSPVPALSPQRTEPRPDMPSPTSTPESKRPAAGPTTSPASIPSAYADEAPAAPSGAAS